MSSGFIYAFIFTAFLESTHGCCRGSLKEGNSGNCVKVVQKAVGARVDGIYGHKTKARVEAFQRSKSLSVDGIVGPQTWSSIYGSGNHSTACVYPYDSAKEPTKQPQPRITRRLQRTGPWCGVVTWYRNINLICCRSCCANHSTSMDHSLPQGFVYLQNIDPTITESVRYAGQYNFLSYPVPGYQASKIVLTQAAAEALKNVQTSMKEYNYSLVIYDAYRPQRSVNAFIAWSEDLFNQTAKALYYPTVNKTDVFALGYVAKKSGHSRGSTVDLSILPLNGSIHIPVLSSRQLQNGHLIPFLDDGSADMGSSFDLFHEVSHHDSSLVDDNATENRNLLRRIMKQHGFREYSREWWHYTLINEPYPNTYFDFIVQ